MDNLEEQDKQPLESPTEGCEPSVGDVVDYKENQSFPEEAYLPTYTGKRKGKVVKLKEKVKSEKYGMADDTHPLRLKAFERSAEIFELRKKGWTIREIAFKFGVNPYVITKVIKREISRVTVKSKETIEDMRQIQLERLDFMLKSLWPLMEVGNANAIEKGLAVMERQAKLMGLDAPEKKQIDIAMDMTDAELISAARLAGIPIPESLDLTGDIIDAPYAIKDKEEKDISHEQEKTEGQKES